MCKSNSLPSTLCSLSSVLCGLETVQTDAYSVPNTSIPLLSDYTRHTHSDLMCKVQEAKTMQLSRPLIDLALV